ncbi:HET-domain-containing protein, partial [Podospora aff. communis PSN243]
CSGKHADCPKNTTQTLPHRVIDVNHSRGSDYVRVCTTSNEMGYYAALSYCWGGPQAVSLTKRTASKMAEQIHLRSLPKTLRDAVFVTRQLGLRYLWVDALCIIQDSTEDKATQLALMARICKDSTVTIAAASAFSVEEGFLETRQPRPCTYPSFLLPFRGWKDKRPINRRAWTLQERLLSPRLVNYGTRGLSWQCQTSLRAHGGMGRFVRDESRRLDSAFFLPDRPALDAESLHDSWNTIVTDYTGREVSFADDKLVALAAVASEFQNQGLGNQYLAGIWRTDLCRRLMWYKTRGKSEGLPQPRSQSYVAPTWSWASVNGSVRLREIWPFGAKANYEILGCTTTLDDESLATGKVKDGILTIRGAVLEARLWERQKVRNLMGGHLDSESEHHVGNAILDADEPRPDGVYMLLMEDGCGMILAPGKEPSTFRRLGFFDKFRNRKLRRFYDEKYYSKRRRIGPWLSSSSASVWSVKRRSKDNSRPRARWFQIIHGSFHHI